MIDSHKTGAYIARLRKERDWTQLELADKLHVTHQAVSRWETGDSFPDLATLAQLAQVFRVRMDALLDGGQNAASTETTRTNVLEELARGHAERVAALAMQDPSSIETVIESGPLTRPSLMNKVVQNMSGYAFSLDQVMALAPFINQELLDSIVDGVEMKLDPHTVAGLAPFLSRTRLNRLVSQLEDGTLEIEHLIGLAPFINHEVLDPLVERTTQDKVEPYHMISLAPFVSRAVLDELVERLPEQGLMMDQISSLAPFLEHSKVAALVSKLGAEQVKSDDLTALAPFLDKPGLQQLVQHVPAEQIDAHTIVALAPFLDQQTLEGLIRGQRRTPPAKGG